MPIYATCILFVLAAWLTELNGKLVETIQPTKVANTDVKLVESNKNHNLAIIPDIAVSSHTFEIVATPQQRAAAEKRAQQLKAAHPNIDDLSENSHPALLFRQNGKQLTESEVNKLKTARESMIKEATIRRTIRTQETITDRSNVDGEDYYLSYSTLNMFNSNIWLGDTVFGAHWSCPNDRVIFNTADSLYSYGAIELLHADYYESYVNTNVHPTSTKNYTITTTYPPYPNAKHSYFEFVNHMEHCGVVSLSYRCANTAEYSQYCGGLLTTKFFYTNTVAPHVIGDSENYMQLSCYDQSKYFCSSLSCLSTTPLNISDVNSMMDNYCSYKYNGFGKRCPDNAKCYDDGSYVCHRGYKDTFYLDHYIFDSNDCTACNLPRGCVKDNNVYPHIEPVQVYYNISTSFSNTVEYVNVQLDNFCDKKIIIDGCTNDQFGDQYFELVAAEGSRVVANDDDAIYRLCSRIRPTHRELGWMCANGKARLGCFGPGNCGGTVDIMIGDPCDVGTYSYTGLKPCIACPIGLTTNGTENMYCTKCADGYIGINGTAPCVPCPDGFIEFNRTTCEPCNANTLHTLTGYMYDQCLTKLLTKVDTLQQRVSNLIGTFDQYLEDVKYGAPTVAPTARPTRRRRTRVPNAGGF